jgi:hypothetical protein
LLDPAAARRVTLLEGRSVPPIRFRTRTIMILIAALAVLMGLFRLMAWMLAPEVRE